ncbi:MAG: glycoside hydrolase [Balneolaceae bacterium]|nr:glycoside hydrolase [Balneolaceae bacterium]
MLMGCSPGNQPKSYDVSDFPDVLDLHGIPEHPTDDEISILTDQGSWFGFALSDAGVTEGFSGPYFISDSERKSSYWQGSSFGMLVLKDEKGMVLKPSAQTESHVYPGRLVHTTMYDELAATNTLIISSAETAILQTKVENKGSNQHRVNLTWTSTLFGEGYQHEDENRLVKIEMGKPHRPFYLSSDKSFSFHANDSTYQLAVDEPIELSAGESVALHMVYSLSLDEAASVLNKSKQFVAENRVRWNNYLQEIFEADTPWFNTEDRRRVSVKSLMTLIHNWRSPHRDLHYNGLFPSYAYQGFHGVWSWDSWKHAVAIALFDPELAEDQLRVMFDYQNEAGMVPDVIYADSTENNWRDTKPPLSVWAVWKIYEQSGDAEFLKEMYPKLKKYHAWWYANRDHDGNGLCEYGSTDGTRIAAAWESGMDNAVRFDDAVMVQNNEGAWSLNQESVDLNSYLYAEKKYLARIAEKLGFEEEMEAYIEEGQRLKDLINQEMYDEETGYYYDKHLNTGSLVTVKGPEGWIPLWAGIADAKQAKAVRDVMMNPDYFFSKVPLPTLNVSHPKFNPQNGYWRGPVWLDQFYFGVKGLSDYGYEEDASALVQGLLRNAGGLSGEPAPIQENYHPVTGEGLNARHFSWSAAHLLMMSNMETLQFEDRE